MAAVKYGFFIFLLSQLLAVKSQFNNGQSDGVRTQIYPNQRLSSLNQKSGYSGSLGYPAVSSTNSFQQMLPVAANQNAGTTYSYQSLNPQGSSLMNAGGEQYSDLQMQQMLQAQLTSGNNIEEQQSSQFQLQSNIGQQIPPVNLQLMQQSKSDMNVLDTNYNQNKPQSGINFQPSLQWQVNENPSLNPKINANQQFNQQGKVNLPDTQQFSTQLDGSEAAKYAKQNQAELQGVEFQSNYPNGLEGIGLQQVAQSVFDLSDTPRQLISSVRGEQEFQTNGVQLSTNIDKKQRPLDQNYETLVAGGQSGNYQKLSTNTGQNDIQTPQYQIMPNGQLAGHKKNSDGILMAIPNDIHISEYADNNGLLESSNVKVDLINAPPKGTVYSLPTRPGQPSNLDLYGNQNHQTVQNPNYGFNQYQQQTGKTPINGLNSYQQGGQNTNYDFNRYSQQTDQYPNYALSSSQQIPNKNNNYMETQIERPPTPTSAMIPSFLGNLSNNLNPIRMKHVLTRISNMVNCNLKGLERIFNVINSNFPNSQLSDQMNLLLNVGQAIRTGLQNAMRNPYSVNGQQGIMNGASLGLGSLMQPNTMSSNGMYGNSQLVNNLMGWSTKSIMPNIRVGTSARGLSQTEEIKDNKYLDLEAENRYKQQLNSDDLVKAQTSVIPPQIVEAVTEALLRNPIPPYTSYSSETENCIREILKVLEDPSNEILQL